MFLRKMVDQRIYFFVRGNLDSYLNVTRNTEGGEVDCEVYGDIFERDSWRVGSSCL